MQKASNTSHFQTIWQLYQQTMFYWGNSVPTFDEFAIITAYNPEGKIITPNGNKKRHKKLLTKVKLSGWSYAALTGCNNDYSHQEHGLAISLEIKEAVNLAIEFDQNAIYYVSNNHLTLHPCLLDGPEVVALGSFSSRLISRDSG